MLKIFELPLSVDVIRDNDVSLLGWLIEKFRSRRSGSLDWTVTGGISNFFR